MEYGRDRRAAIRLTLEDRSAIRWETFRLNFDGKDIPSDRIVWSENREIVIKPDGAWAPESVHVLHVAAEDVRGNADGDWAFVAFTETERKHPKWSVRDDGMILRDGEPWFPLGIYNVQPGDVNGHSCDKAVKELLAAGIDMPHTYLVRGKAFGPHFDELLDACSARGAYLLAEPTIRKGKGRDAMLFDNIVNSRPRFG